MLKLRIPFNFIFSRQLHKEVRNKLKEKKSSKKLALDYFDFFYGSTFGKEWNPMRLALLTERKYTALVNNYSNFIETNSKLEKLGSINLLNFLEKYHEKNKHDVSNIHIPKNINIYTFDNGDTSQYPSPKQNSDNLMNYYCIDGASLLPIFAMNIQKDDLILDLCSSPGGKTLVMLQTLLPRNITCRDISQNRLERLVRMIKSYIPENEFKRLINIEMNLPILHKADEDRFDKVLVDVPCTNDRHSLHTDENNIFSKGRSEERASISKKQAELLTQGILSCKPNGTIIYSTCSLSPIQNEGVVNAVMNSFDGHSKFTLKIEPLDYLKDYFEYFLKFSSSCKTGLLVSPDIKKNFGPFYLCKISKLSK
ncbi:unnamed protein product [Brachionus calyciflorus]|uniref:NOL1/NOP2/Sun domain family member 4 n=1 Tax=Brachionus calyciflorus TaxID=104777 RepID=A0A813Z379_9BILA|nr:unnamed protein product [Brachionus calyciflorus]